MAAVLHTLDAAARERVAAWRAQGRFFWLDVSLRETRADDVLDALGIPAGQLPVGRGAPASRRFYADGESVAFALHCYVEAETRDDDAVHRLRPIEVSVVVTGEYLVTLHEDRVSLPAALAPDLPEGRTRRYVVYSVLDAMLRSAFDALEEVELRLDALASTWTDGADRPAPRVTVRDAGARLATMRRWAGAQQAVFERLDVEVGALRGFEASGERYFQNLDEHGNRLLGSIDAAVSATAMLLELQLNERAYLVSVIATIFVPLTFITGFFGMNFGWMVDHVDSRLAFFALGVAVPVAVGLASWRILVPRFLGDAPPRTRRSGADHTDCVMTAHHRAADATPDEQQRRV